MGAQKVHANPIVSDGRLASRTKSKCDAVAAAIGGDRVKTAQVDADSVPELCELFRSFKPDIVINVALPYQDLTIMDACLECNANYLDSANYEPRDEATFQFSCLGAFPACFRNKALWEICGCGFALARVATLPAHPRQLYFFEAPFLHLLHLRL